jgi:hypothetical protein
LRRALEPLPRFVAVPIARAEHARAEPLHQAGPLLRDDVAGFGTRALQFGGDGGRGPCAQGLWQHAARSRRVTLYRCARAPPMDGAPERPRFRG